MNILLINHYAGSPTHGMEYRPYYLAREWVRDGHNVTIVGASYSHLRSRQPNSNQFYKEEIIDGIRYVWLGTPSYKSNGFGRICNMLAFLTGLYLHIDKITAGFSPNAVIASSTYPLDIYPARRIAQKYHAKLIFEVHDLWPLSPMEIGNMSRYHPFIMLIQAAENYAYCHADKVISILPKAKEHMIAHGMAAEKFVHIPNGICVDEWENIKSIKFQRRGLLDSLKKQGYFVVGYAGAHGMANALYTLIDAKKRLEGKRIAIICIGDGAEKERLQEYAKSSYALDIYFLPAVNKKEILSVLAEFDALYIGANYSMLYQFGISPNKIFDYMMAERPIIHAITAGNDLVADALCGISVSAGNADAIADGIRLLYELSPDEREKMGKRGRAYVLKNHNYRMLAKQFVQAIG